jgi:hypothetical protein
MEWVDHFNFTVLLNTEIHNCVLLVFQVVTAHHVFLMNYFQVVFFYEHVHIFSCLERWNVVILLELGDSCAVEIKDVRFLF